MNYLNSIFCLLIALVTAKPGYAFLPLKTIPSDTDVVFMKWEKDVIPSYKEEELKKVFKQIFPEQQYKDEKYVYNHTRFLDFDVDGLTDIAYYGHVGSESEIVILFRKTGENYTEVFRAWGGITEYSAYKTGKPLSLSILNYGCCASMTDYFYEYEPVYTKQKTMFGYVIKSKYGFFNSTEFPAGNEYLTEPMAFRVVNDKYTLRFSAVINDTIYDGANFLNTGNVVAYYTKGAVGTAVASRIDSTGRVWWFVKMSASIKVDHTELYETSTEYVNTCKKDGIEPDPCIVVGWMSSRYLEKME